MQYLSRNNGLEGSRLSSFRAERAHRATQNALAELFAILEKGLPSISNEIAAEITKFQGKSHRSRVQTSLGLPDPCSADTKSSSSDLGWYRLFSIYCGWS